MKKISLFLLLPLFLQAQFSSWATKRTAVGDTFTVQDFNTVALWRADRSASAAAWADLSGGHDIAQGTADNQPSKSAKYLTFDGNDYMFASNVADTVDFNVGTGDFTIEAYIRWDGAAGNEKEIFSRRIVAGNQLRLQKYLTGFRVMLGSSFQTTGGVFTVAANTWYYVCAGRSGGNTFVYVNNAALGTPAAAGDDVSSTSGYYIGRYAASAANYFTGDIAVIRFSNKARSEAERTAFYAFLQSRF